jgi:SNF2 family DNA or RNA helicase
MRAVCSGKMASGVSAKDQELLDLIPELTADGGKFMLYTPFRRTVERLEQQIAQMFPGMRVVTVVGGKTATQRGSAVKEFQQDPNVRILMMTDAGAEGIDGIQHATNRLVMFDTITNPALEDQIVGRVYRQGQQSPVLRINLKTQGTIEVDDDKTNRRRRMMEMIDHLSRLELTDYGRNLLRTARSQGPGHVPPDEG